MFGLLVAALAAPMAQGLSLNPKQLLSGAPKGEIVMAEGSPAALTNVLSAELARQRKANTRLKQSQSQGQTQVGRIERRLLLERLQAEGYYDATVTLLAEESSLTYEITPNQRYTIGTVKLVTPGVLALTSGELGLAQGQPLRAQLVLQAERQLRSLASRRHCFRDLKTRYQVTLETKTKTALVELVMEPSREVNIKQIRIDGLATIDEDYLLKQLPLASGQCFKPGAIDSARLTLMQTNLLASVSYSMVDTSDDWVDVQFRVTERNHRTIGLSGSFQRDQGFGTAVFWQHRNLLGRGQRLDLETQVTELRQGIGAELLLPSATSEGPTWSLFSELEQEDNDAFESQTLSAGMELAIAPAQHWRYTVGAELTISDEVSQDTDERFTLVSAPLSVTYDRRNDLLDATKGWVVSAAIKPYWEEQLATPSFTKYTLATSVYWTPAQRQYSPTIALRSAGGVITGASAEQVPAQERFFVGGGGSVRGYPFQTLGPLDDIAPIGGLSFVELSLEARWRWSQSWGAVVFADSGFAYSGRELALNDDLSTGVGAGIRYFTGFAPIRFDIAAPLHKRAGIDDNFQLYVSIGQAF